MLAIVEDLYHIADTYGYVEQLKLGCLVEQRLKFFRAPWAESP